MAGFGIPAASMKHKSRNEIAQFGGLLAQIALVAREGGAAENLREVCSQLR